MSKLTLVQPKNRIYDADNNLVCKSCLSESSCKVHCAECGEDHNNSGHADDCMTGAGFITQIWEEQTCVFCDSPSFTYQVITLATKDWNQKCKGQFSKNFKEFLFEEFNLDQCEGEFADVLVCDECALKTQSG